jgi:fatty-acyl-CoA synthase
VIKEVETMNAAGAAALQALPTAATDPDKTAVICDNGESITYGELAERAARIAGALRAHGVREGDVVAILHENAPAYLEIAWACRLAAVYHVTLNTHLGVEEIAYILNDSGASAVIASANLPVAAELGSVDVPRVQHRLVRNGTLPGWEDLDAAAADATPFVADTELEGDLLQYSSGTTGRPKGIKRTMRAAPKTAAEDMTTFLPMLIGGGADSIYLCPAPLYHTAPFMWTMSLLRVGATVVLMKSYEPRACLDLIQRHGVTHGQFVPTMFTRMLKLPAEDRLSYDISSLKGVVHAAAPCPVEVKRQMIEWWGPIVNEYWSSSEGAGFTFITSEDWLTHPGSVGKPVLGQLHICNPLGEEVPVGEIGTIWAEGVEFEYLNDPGKDASTTHQDGWRSVGDIGRFDEEGYLYLTDRANFMIITGGVNIYPQEAENRLIEHPRVLDAAVVGIPDEELGEIAVAVVQPVDPQDTGADLEQELHAWCEGSLARYKCPRRIQFAASLPRSDTGKLYKRKVRDELLAQNQ